MHEDRGAILDLLKSTLVSQKALEEARECFREKEVPQELQHLLSKVATSVESLVLDVAQWGEASVKAMLQTCIASISTIPENLDTAKPEKPLSAVRLYDRSNGNQKAWQDLSPEEKKKWESESEVLQKSFLYLEKSWKERRQVQEKHFEKVREIVDRRISRGLVAADISTLMSMLVGCPTTRVRAYFTRDERVETGKAKADSFPDEEYKWKFVKYSLQRGFESLSAVAFAMTAAHPDFWAVFVFDLVAGLPVEVQAQSRKNADGNFTFTTVGVELAVGFWKRLAKVLEAAVDLGMRLLKESKLQPVQLITGLVMLIFNIFSTDDFCPMPSWLQSAFGRVVAALDPAARALLVDTLVLARLPQAVETCWEQTIRSSIHPPSELLRMLELLKSRPAKDRSIIVYEMMREEEVFALFDDAGKQQICHFLMQGHGDCHVFLFWLCGRKLQAMGLELQISCINWLGAHVLGLVEEGLLDQIDDWLEAFSDSPKLLQSLAVLLMPIFPHFDEETHDRLMELANPISALDLGQAVASIQEEVQQPAADSTEPTQEPEQKRSRRATRSKQNKNNSSRLPLSEEDGGVPVPSTPPRKAGRCAKLLMATPPPLKREKAGGDVPVPSTPVRKAIRAPELLLATPAKSKREQTRDLPVTPPSLKRVRQTHLADEEEPCLEKAPVTPDCPTTKLVPNAPERRKRRSDFMDEVAQEFLLPGAGWPAPVTPDRPTTKLVPNAPERRKRRSDFMDEAEMLPGAPPGLVLRVKGPTLIASPGVCGILHVSTALRQTVLRLPELHVVGFLQDQCFLERAHSVAISGPTMWGSGRWSCAAELLLATHQAGSQCPGAAQEALGLHGRGSGDSRSPHGAMDADAIGAVPWVYYIPVVNVLYDANAVPPSMQQIDQILETFSTLNGLLLSVCIPTVVLFSPTDSAVARARNWNGSYDRYRFFSLSAMFCITAASVSTSLTYLFTRATDFEGAAGVSRAYISWWRYTRWSFLFLILGTLIGSACLSLAIQYAFVLQHAQGQAEADLLSRFMGNWSFYGLLGMGFVVPLAVVSLATLAKQTAIHAVGRITSTSNRQFRSAPKSWKTRLLHNCPVMNIFYDVLFVQVPSSGKINSVMAMLILFNSLLLAVVIPMLQLFDDEKAANARLLNWDGEYDEFRRQVTRGYVCIASAMFQVVCMHLAAVAGTFDSNTAGVGSAVAAWWKVARWNLVVTGSCTCAGSIFLYRAAHLAFKLQHMTTAKEGQEIGRYQDNSLFVVVLGLGVALPLLLLSLAHSRRHRAMNHNVPAKEERQALHRAHYLPVLNIFYDFFASLPETGQLLQVLEVNGTMIALMLLGALLDHGGL
eukprot:s1904_g6.t2